ncbi:hypothetical protein FR943_21670 [Mycobacterium sp. TNTM28]|uniref:SnoaL-like domain-containing protein n=1 Tax=[Mycobacterium] fortunisiensis TaxID=2600579 RepID=A0ABS6KS97_9MYCO|nr:hypothetical protein [[Mycobacterium] fortunisiensis]MBU9766441.1 hypothetical protein [[Mycobacterium] fortunisiensis]
MSALDDVIADSTGRSRTVLQYSQMMKDLVKSAKQPGFSAASWAPLAEFITTEDFVRIGPFKEVMNWTEYTEFLTNWAKSSDWDCSLQRVTEAGELAFLELEERSQIGDFSSVVNTASVFEFTAEDKIRYIAVYLQMELPDPAALPDFASAEDAG